MDAIIFWGVHSYTKDFVFAIRTVIWLVMKHFKCVEFPQWNMNLCSRSMCKWGYMIKNPPLSDTWRLDKKEFNYNHYVWFFFALPFEYSIFAAKTFFIKFVVMSMVCLSPTALFWTNSCPAQHSIHKFGIIRQNTRMESDLWPQKYYRRKFTPFTALTNEV